MAAIGNLDYVKKIPGILQICQLVLGIICLSLTAYYSYYFGYHITNRSENFFSIVSVQYFTITLLLVLNGLSSTNAEERMRQSLFEVMFHFLAVVCYFSGAVALLVEVEYTPAWKERERGFLAAGSLGIINCLLYGASTYYSYQGYVNE